MTLYCFLYNKVPFNADTEFMIMETIKNEPLIIPPPEYRQISEEMMNLLTSLLHKDPSKRAKLSDIMKL